MDSQTKHPNNPDLLSVPKPPKNLSSVPKALKVLPVSREAFYRKLKKKELPSYHFGTKILVDIDEVLAAMRTR